MQENKLPNSDEPSRRESFSCKAKGIFVHLIDYIMTIKGGTFCVHLCVCVSKYAYLWRSHTLMMTYRFTQIYC